MPVLPTMIRARFKVPTLNNTVFTFSYMSNPSFIHFSMNQHHTRITIYYNKALQGVIDIKLEFKARFKALYLLNSDT